MNMKMILSDIFLKTYPLEYWRKAKELDKDKSTKSLADVKNDLGLN
jgi:hypothetical protein